MPPKKKGRKRSKRAAGRASRKDREEGGEGKEGREGKEKRERRERGEGSEERPDGRRDDDRGDAPEKRGVVREETGGMESASGLFKEAIAAFEDAGTSGKGRGPDRPGSLAPDEPGAAAEKTEGRGDVGTPQQTSDREGTAEAEPDENAQAPGTDETGAEAKETAGEPNERTREETRSVGGPEVVSTEEAEEAGKVEEAEAARPEEAGQASPDDRVVRKTLHKKGEPARELEAYEPTQYELHGSAIKFECRCGKRVSAPADSDRAIGRCPKCGVRLLLPGTGPSAGPRTGSNAAVRIEGAPSTDAAAPVAAEEAAAPWIPRFVGFQIDLLVPAAVFFGLFYLLRSLQVEAVTCWSAAFAAAGAAWLVAAIALPAVLSASLGMLMVGLRYRGPDGRPLTFVEALGRATAGLVFSPLAPLSLADPRGRTTADHATGCVVVQKGRTAMGAAKARPGADAPGT